MSTFLIEIDRSMCSGFGSCLKASPTVFALDADGIATLLVAKTADEAVLAAADSCPMGAIAVCEVDAEEER